MHKGLEIAEEIVKLVKNSGKCATSKDSSVKIYIKIKPSVPHTAYISNLLCFHMGLSNC
jgi:hypothetical protein